MRSQIEYALEDNHGHTSRTISNGNSILTILDKVRFLQYWGSPILCAKISLCPSGDDIRNLHWNCVHSWLVHWTPIQHRKPWLCRKVAKLWCSPKHYAFMWVSPTDSWNEAIMIRAPVTKVHSKLCNVMLVATKVYMVWRSCLVLTWKWNKRELVHHLKPWNNTKWILQ